jgi:F-type H+-transporting ATPase subunit epsilon
MSKLHFEIITPDKIAFRDEIDSITLPTQEGEITILPGHIPLVAPIKPGEIMIKKDGTARHMAVMRGFVEMSSDKVRLMAEAAELEEEIDERRAEEAKRRAEQAVTSAKDKTEFADATASLERALTRIKIAKRKHHHHSATM